MFSVPEKSDVTPMLLTARQAAKALTISERTLWSLTQRGEIPAVRFGGRNVRYDPRDLDAWIQGAKNSRKAS